MRLGRAAAVAMVATMTASTAGAYYHFLRYSSRFAPFGPVPEKFDLNALPNRTVTFFVADSGAALVGDGFPSALNLIRDAAAAWNGVPTSELRVAFGGLHSAGTPQSTAGAEIYFEELDPLTLGLASPTVRGGLQPGNNGNGPFVPIVRSVVRLNRDLAQWRTPASGPSFHEAFFNTVVHEMGHALGLQHTFTSSAMSTEVTRSTTLARPIDADDAAGLSALYPSRNFAPSTGSLAGRVTYQGTNQGVHMASVVAIRPGGIAVSALTDPDGRYRIDGLAPNPYQLYVHPLPAVRRAGLTPGDMVLPVYPDGQPAAANTDFDTAFYQNGQTTREFLQASFVAATAGGTADNLNFAVRRRTTASLGAVTIYSFFGSTAVSPGFVNGGGSLVARGAGLAANNTPAAGLSAAFLGGTPTLLPTLRAYNGADLVLDIQPTSTFGGVGARHAVFTLPGDLHVRPNAIHLVQERPPSITAAIPGFDSAGGRTVTLAGTGLNAETRIYFDGVRAPDLSQDQAGRLVVALPPGLAGQRAVITAFNPDGQNSMFLQAGAPASFSYDSGDPGAIAISPAALPAGSESMVEITGIGTSFTDGLTLAGFGSSDVQVRRIWVTGPGRALANVWVSPDAAAGATLASVITGTQVIAQPFAFQILAANPALPALSGTPAAANGVYPGATVAFNGSNLASATVTVAGLPATVLSSTPSLITFRVPLGVAIGPAIVRFGDSVSLVLQIDPLPPEIRGITSGVGAAVDATRPARIGDLLYLLVAGLGDASLARISIRVGGVEHQGIELVAGAGGTHTVPFVLLPSAPVGAAPVTIAVDGRASAPFVVSIVR